MLPAADKLQATDSSDLRPPLSRLLEGIELGGWSLDSSSFNVLWHIVEQENPSTILEFGSGVSSLVLGHWVAQSPDRFLVSLEQDSAEAKRQTSRLAARNLSDQCVVVHAPTRENGRYEIDHHCLSQVLGDRHIDLVFIDGPAGPPGCRDSTLSAVVDYCRRGARWVLDDAFRDGEIGILRSWSRVSGISIEGIIPIGTGLAVGKVVRPSSRRRDRESSPKM